MKRLTCISVLLALMAVLPLKAQDSATQVDSAAIIVDNFLRMLNYEAIDKTQTLYIESHIYDYSNRKDTLYMKRWFTPPHYFRTELWFRDTLRIGFYTDGMTLAKQYDIQLQEWKEISLSLYYDFGSTYDFHSPLYNWRMNGTEMRYEGKAEALGQKVYKVHVATPGMYVRDYLFDIESGLLYFVIEHPETFGGQELVGNNQVDWRAFTQYYHEGECLLPYTESYRKDGRVTVIDHRYSLQPVNLDHFNKD